MGFLANIAGGLAQSGLDRHQTDLIRKMEEERFARQQQAQIASEQRQDVRDNNRAERSLLQNLALQGISPGEVSGPQGKVDNSRIASVVKSRQDEAEREEELQRHVVALQSLAGTSRFNSAKEDFLARSGDISSVEAEFNTVVEQDAALKDEKFAKFEEGLAGNTFIGPDRAQQMVDENPLYSGRQLGSTYHAIRGAKLLDRDWETFHPLRLHLVPQQY